MAVETVLGNISNAAKGLVILFSSMAPFVENKGSILLAAALHLNGILLISQVRLDLFYRFRFCCIRGKGEKAA